MPERRPPLIIIQGHPCTGKTVLANKLSEEFRIPALCRDQFKELLFDELGVRDRDWSMKLGGASYSLLFLTLEKVLQSGAAIILESNFNPKLHRDLIQKILEKYDYKVIEIFLYAEPKVLVKRFMTRWESGSRHRGHVDSERYGDLEARLKAENSVPFNLTSEILKVDTTRLDDLDWSVTIRRLKDLMVEE